MTAIPTKLLFDKKNCCSCGIFNSTLCSPLHEKKKTKNEMFEHICQDCQFIVNCSYNNLRVGKRDHYILLFKNYGQASFTEKLNSNWSCGLITRHSAYLKHLKYQLRGIYLQFSSKLLSKYFLNKLIKKYMAEKIQGQKHDGQLVDKSWLGPS